MRVDVRDVAPSGDRPVRVVAEVRSQTSGASARGWRAIRSGDVPRELEIAVASDVGPIGGPGELEVAVVGGSATLATGAEAALALSIVRATDDDLRIVYAGETVVYERLNALPRIRWASEPLVEADASERVRLLAEGALGPDTVILDESGPSGGGTVAAVNVLEDGGSRMRIEVDADGPGYLVVADPLHVGWSSQRNGEEVPLHKADHVGVAVHVPAGRHIVALSHDPPGWSWALPLSIASILVLLGGLLGDPRSWRRRQAARSSRDGPGGGEARSLTDPGGVVRTPG